jgi:hypothetical protein
MAVNTFIKVVTKALSFPGAHVIAGQDHRESFLNQQRRWVIA